MISEIHALNPNTVSRSFWKRNHLQNLKGGSMGKESRILQWHPAFYVGVQLELEKEAGELAFDNEHQLGTKPREIDVLIIKKTVDYQVQKNIGRMFRRYNIVEYKSPGDYLSINDFYMGCAYVCLYKVDTAVEDERRIGELTLTFAAARYPRKLIAHLTKERGYSVEEAEQGIYYVKGAFVPIQILVLSRLSEKENLWLRVLSNELKGKEIAGRALAEYRKHQNNGLYSSVIDIMIRANRKRFVKEGSVMSEEFESLLNEKLAMREERGRSIGLREGKLATVRNLKKINMPVDQIAEIVEESLETVEQWLNAC